MPIIQSDIDVHGEEFATNREAMLKAVASFREIEQNCLNKAAEAKPKFEKRGQLLPRERLNLLLDPGAPFLELSSLAGYKLHDDKDGTQAGGGIISGIGYIAGVRCLVTASNSAIKGGTISPTGLKKTLRLQQIAFENKLPVVALTESGGANLNYAADIFVEGARGLPTRRACPPWACRRSPWCTVPPPPAEPTSRGCRTMWWWCVARPRCSSPARRC